MEKQLTAVEWLVEKLEIFATEQEMNIIEQAKAMEKGQIIKAYKRESCYMKHAGCTDEQINQSAVNYYNETFKSE